ncbi:uncharacterized protein L201_005129 [Kwoniella dendrophila CBS 6074]|uniref:Peroxin-7 n=1 Tax=Kwoniella dendrophila CBS 6074 TaxID=1295534 RepID=A0AAX4JXN7_9TREE
MQRSPQSPPFLRYKTPNFSHNNLSFSPYFEQRLALASGSNFGLVGNGRIHIINLDPNIHGGIRPIKYFETRDCVFDIAWNESHENQIAAGCGNGAIKLFDVTLEGLPIKSWHEHLAEIMSIEWNNLQKDTFVTSSWDSTIKVWNASRTTSFTTIKAHRGQIYNATFSPHSPFLILSCGSDGYINLFDLRSPSSSSPSIQTSNVNTPNQNTQTTSRTVLSIPAGLQSIHTQNPIEILYCDWNKYDQNIIASSSKNGEIKMWDFRYQKHIQNPNTNGSRVIGKHNLASRKVYWNPHKKDSLLSSSYDMTVRTWNTNPQVPGYIHSAHTEFVMAVGWSLYDPGLIASAAWDEEVHLYRT